MVAVSLEISSGPAVSSVPLISTVLKSRAASWVRNGIHWMDTLGLPDRSRFDLIWLAIAFSVIAAPARSATTSSTTITINVMIGHRLRRRLRTTGAPWYGPADPW